jgi:Tol biopolymer transport system component
MRHLMFALGVLVLAAVAIGAWQLLSSDGDESGKPDAGSTFVTVSPSSDLAVLDLATGRTRLVTHAGGRYLAVAGPTWSPDGRRIAFARQTCPHCPFQASVIKPGRRSARLLPGWREDSNEPTWSPDGGRVVVTTSHAAERSLALLDLRDGRGRALVIHENAADGGEEEEIEHPNHPSFSPDARTVAFEAETTGERTRIFLLDLVSGDVGEIENDAVGNAYPAFSPTGKRLAFSQTDAGYAWDVCTVRPDGSDQVCLTRSPANDVEPTWSPDARSIIFSSDRDDPNQLIRSLYSVRSGGNGLRRLTKGFDDGAPAVSPDGTEVAFVRRQIVRVNR